MTETTTDDDPTTLPAPAKKEKKYLQFERDAESALRKSDPAAAVTHNKMVPGLLSKINRQIDVLATNSIVDEKIMIVAECKRYKRKLDVGKVDEFVGKLLDVGAERGILYGYSGVTPAAQARADNAPVPRVVIRDLTKTELPPWSDDLREFEKGMKFGDCSNPNCTTGDIIWADWPQENGPAIKAGKCWVCGTWAVRCVDPDCETVSGPFEGTVDCEGCERVYERIENQDGSDVTDVIEVV